MTEYNEHMNEMEISNFIKNNLRIEVKVNVERGDVDALDITLTGRLILNNPQAIYKSEDTVISESVAHSRHFLQDVM